MAVILAAHYYQESEIPGSLADFVGDSLQLLSQQARKQTSSDVIVFAGVLFYG